ncbi:MAG: hypothetical protein HFJ84_02405 [Clostridiales bacterium]|nr:hypothetical protein [Clostridiales bacterium]
MENVEKVLVDNIFLSFGRNIQIYNQLFYFLGKAGNPMELLRRVINEGRGPFSGENLGENVENPVESVNKWGKARIFPFSTLSTIKLWKRKSSIFPTIFHQLFV